MRKASEIIFADARFLGKKDGYEEVARLYKSKISAAQNKYTS